jgi:hypothetical protein
MYLGSSFWMVTCPALTRISRATTIHLLDCESSVCLFASSLQALPVVGLNLNRCRFNFDCSELSFDCCLFKFDYSFLLFPILTIVIVNNRPIGSYDYYFCEAARWRWLFEMLESQLVLIEWRDESDYARRMGFTPGIIGFVPVWCALYRYKPVYTGIMGFMTVVMRFPPGENGWYDQNDDQNSVGNDQNYERQNLWSSAGRDAWENTGNQPTCSAGSLKKR